MHASGEEPRKKSRGNNRSTGQEVLDEADLRVCGIDVGSVSNTGRGILVLDVVGEDESGTTAGGSDGRSGNGNVGVVVVPGTVVVRTLKSSLACGDGGFRGDVGEVGSDIC